MVAFACATTDDSRGDSAQEAQVAKTRHALIVAADADSLAAAALLGARLADHDAQRIELLDRAVSLAPNRYDLAWLDFESCDEDKLCDAGPRAARLKTLDRKNAVSWIGDLSRGHTRSELDTQTAIRGMADSEHFNLGWNAIVLNLANAIGRTGTLDRASSVVAAVGIASATAVPAYGPVSKACNGDNLNRPERIEDCRRLTSVMLRGDTYVTELVGAAIAKRIWPAGSDEYEAAERAIRTARYRMGQAISANGAEKWESAAYAEKYLGWLEAYKTEQEVSRAEIIEAGRDPDPPPGWKLPPPGSI